MPTQGLPDFSVPAEPVGGSVGILKDRDVERQVRCEDLAHPGQAKDQHRVGEKRPPRPAQQGQVGLDVTRDANFRLEVERGMAATQIAEQAHAGEWTVHAGQLFEEVDERVVVDRAFPQAEDAIR